MFENSNKNFLKTAISLSRSPRTKINSIEQINTPKFAKRKKKLATSRKITKQLSLRLIYYKKNPWLSNKQKKISNRIPKSLD